MESVLAEIIGNCFQVNDSPPEELGFNQCWRLLQVVFGADASFPGKVMKAYS